MGKVYSMVIKYLDSKRIKGLSTDTPTYETDFTTNTGWAATGTDVAVDSTTNDRLDFNIPNTANQTDAITYDLTSTSDSAWVLRFKLDMNNFSTNSTGHAKKLLIGLSSTSHSTDVDSAQDAIGILFGSWSSGSKIRSRDSDGGSWMGGSGTDFATTFVDNDIYYVEIKRTSTTAYTVSLYSDSTYSTLIEAESETMASTIAGLRYLKVGIDTTTGTPTGTFTGYIDDVKFYNGVTTPSIKPTNVQDNSIFVEQDTGERYWRTPESSGADTTTTNSNVNDVAHFEGANPANSVIGEQITSGNALIGQTITSLSFWLYKLNSGSSGTETFTFGVWNSSGANVHEFGTVTRGELPQGTAFGNAVKFTKSTGSYVLQTNDILGIRTNSAPASAWTVEVTQRDSNVYSDGQRAIFVQGVTPTTSAKDIGFEVVSNTVTPATWTNPVCAGTISSTATMGSNGDFDVEYTTVASKTGSGQRGCNAWEFNGLSTSPYTGRNAVKGATNADFAVSSSTAFTIAAWVKLNTLGQQHTILGYSGHYTNTFWTNLGISAANKVEGHTANNGISNNYIPTGNSLSVDTWHHCVFIHGADNSVTVYLDADTANKGTGTGDTGSASSGYWTIAGRWGQAVIIPTFPFLDGFIDQATLWNVALSEADVITLYNGGRLTPPSVSQNNIKGYWTFSETSGAAENKAV